MCSASSPLPLALIVASNQNEFGEHAWRAIRSEYIRRLGDNGDPKTHPPETLPSFGDEPTSEWLQNCVRAQQFAHEALIPYPLDHGTGAQARSPAFRRRVFDLLTTHDVVGIISSAPAEQNAALIEVAASLCVPLFSTVDSTIRARTRDVSHLKWLMPSNDLQAQAIVGRVTTLLELQGAVPVTIFQQDHLNTYVQDLTDALYSQFEIARLPAPVVTFQADDVRADADTGIVVLVGYVEGLVVLGKALRTGHSCILSDGCFRPNTLKQIKLFLSTRYYWTRPVYPPENHALSAYVQLSRVAAALSARELPKQRLTVISDRVVAELQRDRWGMYEFEGHANQRGGYITEYLSEKTRKEWARIFGRESEKPGES